MGIIMKNGVEYGNSGMITLTQADYDALSEEEVYNDTLYCISDADDEMSIREYVDDKVSESIGGYLSDIEDDIEEIQSTSLTKTEAQSTYLAKTEAQSTYLAKTEAQSTYLASTTAVSTYFKKSSLHVSTAEPTSTDGEDGDLWLVVEG